ncbi:hypothetical protein AB1Y20_021288 [Prymnesium parvum]|uniref:Plastid lipid-associated protein/fibrillin conserved domain-containing protein n=1 Tax=Prymnesium parvum TaxID=97485 RepID=A0AB34JJ70_PRYPA
MALFIGSVAAAVVLSPATGRTAGAHRGSVRSRATTQLSELLPIMSKTKDALLRSLSNNSPITPEGVALVDQLEASAPPVPGDVVWWLGRYELRSTHDAFKALEQAGERVPHDCPVLVTVSGDGGKQLNIDIGEIQLLGALQHGLLPGDDVGLLRASLKAVDFLPKASKGSLTLRPVFVDEDFTVLRDVRAVVDEVPLIIVLSRLSPADDDELTAGFEVDDDYGA